MKTQIKINQASSNEMRDIKDWDRLFTAIQQFTQKIPKNLTPGQKLNRLIKLGLTTLPLPAQGETLMRWRILAAIAAHDLSLVKLYEAHTDALAILQELTGQDVPPQFSWGVWCAEGPDSRVNLTEACPNSLHSLKLEKFGRKVCITGTKSWCSGAADISHALISVHDENDTSFLVAVDLNQPGVRITNDGWNAIGMAKTRSVKVVFDDVIAYKVGWADAYIKRPGFWHGGAGIAACWYGAATSLATIVRNKIKSADYADPHKLSHLGNIEVALASATSVLRETARYLDDNPAIDSSHQCLKARLVIEDSATKILEHSGRALGASAFCQNHEFAQMHADLTVFLRQSHAEKDLETLAHTLKEDVSWAL